MKVKATALGFYGGALRQPGEEFDIASEAELGDWMDAVKTAKPKAAKPAAQDEADDLA